MKRRLVSMMILAMLPSLAPAAGEWEASWTWFQGPFQRHGDLQLRLQSDELGALRWTLPESALLPRAQVLLLDGPVLLAWTEPEGAPAGLDPADRRLAPLARLGAGFLEDLFRGEEIESHFREAGQEQERGWTRLEGSLAGYPALLVHSRGRARSLHWNLPEGEMKMRWSRSPRRGERQLLILPQEGGKLLIELEKSRPGPLDPAALFFPQE